MDIVPFSDQYDVSGFSCGDKPCHADLNDFLKSDALRYAKTWLSQTYVAVEDHVVVGYVTLLMDAIRVTPEEKGQMEGVAELSTQTIPALKVGRLARLSTCQIPRVGTILMRFAFDKLNDLSEYVGCRFLSVDAISCAIPFYKKLGFVPNLHGSLQSKNRSTVSMRFDAFAPNLPDWTRRAPMLPPEIYDPSRPLSPQAGNLGTEAT